MAKRLILGESGGPTPVIDWEVAGAVDQAQKAGWEVYGMVNGLEGLLNANIEGNIVNLTDMDPMSFAFNGPGACLRTTRLKPKEAQYRKMAEHLSALGITAVIYFGGNDSAEQLRGLGQFTGIQLIHGIKTIDNDLPETHHCPGYGSACLFNATALKNVYSDYSSYRSAANYQVGGKIVQGFKLAPVAIYQVMGRKAGWLAQGAAFAKVDPKGELIPERPPHIVLCMEVPFDKDRFLGRVDDVISRHGEAVIVVQEDLLDARENRSIVELHGKDFVMRDDFGNPLLGRSTSFSTAIFVAQLCTEELKVKAVHGEIKEAAFVPQHIQRSCMMSPVDAAEAYQVGAACVEVLEAGQTNKSVIIRREHGRTLTGLTDVANIAAKERAVPLHYINDMDGPTQEFVDEYIYLIGGPAAIPHYSNLRPRPVAIPQKITANPYVSGK